MSLRRFGPLMIACLVALVVLSLRLFQVQIVEHQVWAREAANLSRESEVLPYLRGEIRDRSGIPLAQDESVYRLEFAYREFRREHPVGQVAHALSDLTGHAAPLVDVAADLEAVALALVALTPGELDEFGGGAALPAFGVPRAQDGGAERRASRAGSARFYVAALLGLDRVDWSRVKREIAKGDRDRSFFALAQAHRKSAAETLEDFTARVRQSRVDLDGLAASLDLSEFARGLGLSEEERDGSTGLTGLLRLLQHRRDAIEDDVAGDLFAAAAGFPVGVLPPEVLREWFDLSWIAKAQGWDDARLDAWLDGPHRRWLSNRRSFHAPAAWIQSGLDEVGLDDPGALERFLDEASRVYEPREHTRRERLARLRDGEPPWWRLERCMVLDELVDVLDAPWPEESDVPGMPFQDAEWRAARAADEVTALDACAAFGVAPTDQAWRPPGTPKDWTAPADADAWRARWISAYGPQPTGDDVSSSEARKRNRRDRELLPLAFQEGWLEGFQARVRRMLWEAGANAEARGARMPFEFRRDRLDRAADRRNYAVRDRGSRVVVVDGAPHVGVVQKISRFPGRFAGFRVRDVPRRRSLIQWEGDVPLAEFQVGGVRHSTLTESVGQTELLKELRELQRTTDRDAVLREAIAELAREIYRADEQRGRSGAELLYDEELRGKNGYREREGLKERRNDPRKEFFQSPVHGLDLELSISVPLQRAAQEVISRPAPPPADAGDRDDAWFASPVGAIVMITPDGEVLAAASAPREKSEPLPGRSGQRASVIDRTMRLPTGQPPGSIFKPLIAAHAMETHGLDAAQQFLCADEAGTGPSYGGLHCHSRIGHGSIALHDALQESCNCYFAQVGELYASREEYLDLAHFWGLDQPTGINVDGRRGYYEDYRVARLREEKPLSRRDRLAGGNGLSPIEATPLQMARAFAGLATGDLPELRLVRAVGDQPVPKAARRLPISSATRRFLTQALIDVCEHGSAKKARLTEADLGFPVAAKTGSADFLPMNDAVLSSMVLSNPSRPPSMRKHTWVAGWFPAWDPRAVVVVYLHDIGATSSKNAIYVAEQFLHRPEVAAYLEGAIR